MDFSQIQHGNVYLPNLLNNGDYADLMGTTTEYQQFNPKDDAKLIVRFISAPLLLEYVSNQLKRPKVIQSDFISIRLDEFTEHFTEVGFERDVSGAVVKDALGEPIPTEKRKEYLSRWPKAWEAYQKQFEQAVGTPLSQLANITLSEIASLQLYKIKTIEAFAESNDRLYDEVFTTREGGGTFLQLREQARQYVKENGQIEMIIKAKAEAEAEAEAMKNKVKELEAYIASNLKQDLISTGPTNDEAIKILKEQQAMEKAQLARKKLES